MTVSVTITPEQLALRVEQRTMIAARLVTVDSNRKLDGQVSGPDAAKLLGVSKGAVARARIVLKHGTPEIIKAVEDGRIGVAGAWSLTNKPGTGEKRLVGRNLTRIERERQQRIIWRNLRGALLQLTSLPLPADVVTVARAMDRHKTIMPKLPAALAWLQEFSNVVSDGEAAREERAARAEGSDAAAAAGEV